MESSDYDVKRYGLGIDSILRYSFNCCLVFLIEFWRMFYGITNLSKEASAPVLI